MKQLYRLFVLILAFSAMLLSTACSNNGTNSSEPEPSSNTSPGSDVSAVSSVDSESDASYDKIMSDTLNPIIRISYTYKWINQYQEYDLLDGIIGSDNREGNITDRIEIDKGGFDPGVPGEYMIKYNLQDTAGNKADEVKRTVVVRDSTVLACPPVYTGNITGEILNPENPGVFGGAWYHKAVSSKDKWCGIEGTITLPEVDIDRYDGEYKSFLNVDPDAKNLDNPSVYLGGYGYSESDIGLSFSRCLINVQNNTLSKGCIAFRPFWRYITAENQDVGDYDTHNGEYAVSANGNNCIANYHWRYTEFYYLPGDKLRIIIHIPEADKMQLQIEVIEKSTLVSSVEIRKKYGWKDPENFKSPVFAAPGHGTSLLCEYKRVNAIDQVANEGGTAIVSTTEVKNAIWHDTYLYRVIDGTMYRVPMVSERKGVTSAPYSDNFTILFDRIDPLLGGEVITIHPGYKN